ncbi:HAD family hydrolase [Streptomyces sp. NPDC055103]
MSDQSAAPYQPILSGVRAVVFDFDGTLADTTEGHRVALQHALDPYGVALDARWYREHVGLSIHDLLVRLPGAENLAHDTVVAASRAYLLRNLHTLTPIPATLVLLHAARESALPCAIASGASGLLVRPALNTLRLEGLFETVVVREDVSRGKPAPDLYLEAARRLGVAPEECLAVDDADDGLAAAHRAGMRALTLADSRLVPATGAGR